VRHVIFIGAVGAIVAFFGINAGWFSPGHQLKIENRSGQCIAWLEFRVPGETLRFQNLVQGEKRETSFTRNTSWGTVGVTGELADQTKIDGAIGMFFWPDKSPTQVAFAVEKDGSITDQSPQ